MLYDKCQGVFKITHQLRNVIYFLHWLSILCFLEAYCMFSNTAYCTRHKLTENERNTGRCTTESSEKGMNGYWYIGANDLIGIYLRDGHEQTFNINNEPHIFITHFWTGMYKNYPIFLKHCLHICFYGSLYNLTHESRRTIYSSD